MRDSIHKISEKIRIVKIVLLIMAIAITLCILLEVGLRLILGLGNPLIYRADSGMGYILAPDQKVRRFDKNIEINQYSMRSPDITPTRPLQSLRILLLGDSIANGAWWTDQKETISALIEKQLPPAPGSQIEVLNASANSWGPRNQLAYLKKYGSFEAQIIILLMNTDDLFSGPPNPFVVGKDPNYPEHRPPLALIELWQRYKGQNQPMTAPPKDQGDIVGINLAAVQSIYAYSLEHQAQLILGITPLLREVQDESRSYEVKARQRLEDWTGEQNIPYLDFLPIFKAINAPDTLYRDTIHLTPLGNEIVTKTLTVATQKILAETSQKSP